MNAGGGKRGEQRDSVPYLRVRMHVQCRVSESKDNMGDEQSRAGDKSCGSGKVDEGESSEGFVVSRCR